MGNKTVGKKFDRQSTKAVISAIDMKQFNNYMQVEGEIMPISNRIEFRETIEEWGYLWAHRLLEDAYIRPNFDIQKILKGITNDSLEELNFSIRSDMEDDQSGENCEVNNDAKLIKLEELKNKFHIQKKKQSSSKTKNSLSTIFMVTRKVLWHVHVIGLAITAVEIVLEGEKHEKMISTIDLKVQTAKRDINESIFDLRLTDLKTKFLAIKNTFDLVLYGSDDNELRKSRLDSVFVICEEIFLIISEPTSEFYKSAHWCIDLVVCFMVMHLGMLNLAVEAFDLNDYQDRLDYCFEFYPILSKSYVEQAISNYVRPIILNYHNQYNSSKEVEEIYYDLTNSVIYKRGISDLHIWWKTSLEELAKDNMYYNFKMDKFKIVEPPLLMGPETPLLCRALRYGVILKLEDLFTPYESSMNLIIHKIKNTLTREEKFDEYFDDWDKENEPIDEEVKQLPEDEWIKDIENFESVSPIKHKSKMLKRCQTIQPGMIDYEISPPKDKSVHSQSPSKAYNSLEKSEVLLVDPNNYHLKVNLTSNLINHI